MYIIYIYIKWFLFILKKIFNPLHSLATMRKTNDIKMNCKKERERENMIIKKLTDNAIKMMMR